MTLYLTIAYTPTLKPLLPLNRKMKIAWEIRYILVVGCARLVSGAWNVRDDETGIVGELGARLSEGAQVLLEGEEGFAERMEWWQRWKNPDVAAVVDVKTEEDVQETVCARHRLLMISILSFKFHLEILQHPTNTPP